MNQRMKASLEHMRDELQANRLGAIFTNGDGCVYEDDRGRHCAIGCLLPPGVLEWVKETELNTEVDAQALYDEVENKRGINLEHLLGFDATHALILQRFHDSAFADRHWQRNGLKPDDFKDLLDGLLDGSITEIALRPYPGPRFDDGTSRVAFT